MEEYLPSYREKQERWERACSLIARLEQVASLLQENGEEANNALWSIAEGKTDHDDPKTINAFFQDIRCSSNELLKEARSFMAIENVEAVIPPDRLGRVIARYEKRKRKGGASR